MMEHLWSPWRMTYLRADKDDPKQKLAATGLLRMPTCIFCDLPAEHHDDENLIAYRGERAFVMLNRYPYNNGHLMVIPFAHQPSFEFLDAPTLTEIMGLSNQALRALRRVYQPQAFNLGANIGTAAGAGIAEHVHWHIVPRWAGDTNFMSVTSGTRVIPEDLRETLRLVRAAWV
jgi:ATP adenylyltransferase